MNPKITHINSKGKDSHTFDAIVIGSAQFAVSEIRKGVF